MADKVGLLERISWYGNSLPRPGQQQVDITRTHAEQKAFEYVLLWRWLWRQRVIVNDVRVLVVMSGSIDSMRRNVKNKTNFYVKSTENSVNKDGDISAKFAQL